VDNAVYEKASTQLKFSIAS